MRHVRTLLTACALVISVLSGSGCAGTRTGLAAAERAPADPVKVGQLDDPAFVFSHHPKRHRKNLRVCAMAYTCGSRKSKHGAWGDPLTPGIKAVAVSPDLLELGLDHGDTIRIEGLPGEYKVLDVMHSRHSRAIDIFYGSDRSGALSWGTRTLRISWQD